MSWLLICIGMVTVIWNALWFFPLGTKDPETEGRANRGIWIGALAIILGITINTVEKQGNRIAALEAQLAKPAAGAPATTIESK